MRKQIDRILSDDREIERDEIKILNEEVNPELYNIKKREFYRCAHPSDPDYEYISYRDCEGTVEVDSDRLQCEECGRIITDPYGKEKFQKNILYLDRSGIRDEIRKKLKTQFDTTASTVSRTYFGHEFSYVLNVDDPNINLFILFSSIAIRF